MGIKGFYKLSDRLDLSISQISCGHLREPFLSGKREITGYCSIFECECSYQVPFQHCQKRKNYLELNYAPLQKTKSKLEIGMQSSTLTEEQRKQIINYKKTLKEYIKERKKEDLPSAKIILFPTQKKPFPKRVPQVTDEDIKRRFNRNR